MRPVRTLALAAVLAWSMLAWAPGAGAASPGVPDRPAGPDSRPEWAYPWAPDYRFPPAGDGLRRVPGSTLAFAADLMSDPFFTPAWHPQDHPPMPDVVARGRKPAVRACGSCHRAEGTGAPENASLAGLPEAYIVRQMAGFRSGERRSAGPPRPTVRNMIATANAASDAEILAAARYFSSLRPRKILRVVETDTLPKVHIAGMAYARDPDGGREALGRRIIELADHPDDVDNNDPRATFTAFAPVGSLARGQTLATTGDGGRTVACTACHGTDLRGQDEIPGLAGRSPSYLARQLYDFQQGTRAGAGSLPMAPVVATLTHDDLIALAAYLASLPP